MTMQTQEHGGDIYSASYRMDFSVSINPLGTPHSVRSAVIRSTASLGQYPDVRCRDLRRKLSDRFRIPAHWITCGNGAAELIFAVAQAVKPQTALLVCPGFSEYERALRVAGCQDLRFYLCPRSGGFRIGEDILEQITEDIDMMYLCNPSNPTGILSDQELMVRILEKCRDNKVVLVVDECFLEMTSDPSRHTLMGYIADNPNLLILRSFTKTYAMPGVRLGYCITNNRQMTDRIRDSIQPWPVSIPAQMAGEAALEEEDYLKEARELIQKELRYLKQSFEVVGIQFYDSAANFLLFEGPKNLLELCAKKGILIRDCRNYRGLGTGYFRASVHTRRDNEELCGVLSDIYRTSGHYLTDRAFRARA
ncbi:MAG TPA: threonine-phosphate decarboxylase [Lachnospiraceae bacterium]|nr:threonine-phosphate decarboxylase [Lachnospiraceae bacterium]